MNYDPAKMSEYNARARAKLRARVVDGYGGACSCCGRRDRLELDHVKPIHRRSNGNYLNNERAWRDAAKRACPPDYQLLCAPCNAGKGVGAFCDIPEHQGYRNG